MDPFLEKAGPEEQEEESPYCLALDYANTILAWFCLLGWVVSGLAHLQSRREFYAAGVIVANLFALQAIAKRGWILTDRDEAIQELVIAFILSCLLTLLLIID